MKQILILTGRYLPGYKDGGPLRTICNLVEALGDEFEFYIACYDRDHGDTAPYSGICHEEWNQVGKAKVWYVRPGGFTNELILTLAKDKDYIYLTSFYESYGYRALLLRRRGIIKTPVALASMGVFSKGALAQKTAKKKAFISGCKMLGLFREITWSVTSELEAEDLRREIGKKARYVIAEDLPRSSIPGLSHRAGEFKVVFLSRICPKKNLLGAIEALKQVQAELIFDIYGPIEDEGYWHKCQAALQSLPPQISWSYRGTVPGEEVQNVFAQYDVFLFPTLGENYGHVIFEALSVGCVPVISDSTPWSFISEKDAGFVVKLDRSISFSRIIDMLNHEDRETINRIAQNAVQLAVDTLSASKEATGYRTLFS